MFRYLREGRLSPGDFTKLSHRRLVAFLTKILVQAHPSMEVPVPVDLVLDYLSEMRAEGAISRTEKEDILDAIEDAWSVEIVEGMFDDNYVAQLSAIQRAKKMISDFAGKPNITVDDLDRLAIGVADINSKRKASVDPSKVSNLLLCDGEIEEYFRSEIVHSQSDLLRTGIPSVDRALGGGTPFNKMAMVCAYTGIGKTVFGLNVGWNAALDGYDTAYVTTEMTAPQLKQRLMSRITRTPIQWITKGRSEIDGGVESVVVSMAESYRQIIRGSQIVRDALERFHIISLHSDQNVTTDTIEGYLDRLERESGRRINVCVIDWMDRMVPIPRKRELKDVQNRMLLSNVSEDIERMVTSREKFFVYALTQGNDNAKTRFVKMTHTSESRAKNHPVSIFYGLGTTDQNRASGLWTLTVDKNRDGAVFSMDISGDMEFMTFGDAPEAEELLVRRARH